MDAIIKRLTGLGLLFIITACGGSGGGQAQDPLVEGFPIAYVKRPIPVNEQGGYTYPDARDPAAFNPGADLFIRDHASSQAAERNITKKITHDLGNGSLEDESFDDVKDVEVSYDGTRLLFAMRKPEIPNADPEDQPTWNIWEYHIPSQRLRRLIEIDDFAEEGQDVAPYYLPDGRIVFSSSRQHRSKEVLTDEGKPAYTTRVDREEVDAMMLHVMESDGTEIKQLTFSPKRDMDPMVRSDGKIIFSRWDRNRLGNNEINLYSINPDGSDLQLLYGSNSHATGTGMTDIQFMQAREFHDGRLLTLVRPYMDTFGGGDMVLIDTDYFVDYGKPNKDNQGLPGTGQESLTGGRVSTLPGPSEGGRYVSVYPLADGSNRSLVSWSQCRVVINDKIVSCTQTGLIAGEQEAAPFYGLFVHDHSKNTQLPIITPKEGIMIADVVATQERPYPPVIEDTPGDGKTGILHIRSVYDFDGAFDPMGAMVRVPSIPCSDIPQTDRADFDLPPDRAPNSLQELADYGVIDSSRARFLRLVRPMTNPGPEDIANNILNIASGSSNRGRHGYVDIIGYAPIEPDGSVKVEVPADVPFSIQILDGNGRRIDIPNAQDNIAPRHVTWLQVKSGETMTCNGCHIRGSQTSHGNNKAVATLNPGADSARSYACMEDNMLAAYGETMAETRTRICESADCNGVEPNVNLVYDDLWTKTIDSLDAVNVFGKGNSISLLYSDAYNLNDDPIPLRRACANSWSPNCRVTINYVDHIAPLWSRPGRVNAASDPATCSQDGCHSPIAVDGIMVQVPAPANGSQLNLNDSIQSTMIDPLDGQNQIKSYRELFVRDVQQASDGLALTNVQVLVDVPQVDDDGNPVLDGNGDQIIDSVLVDVPTAVGPPMSVNGANASRRFFNELENDPGGTFDHTGALSPAELKLISEWLDGGGQYYNNPFVVPVN